MGSNQLTVCLYYYIPCYIDEKLNKPHVTMNLNWEWGTHHWRIFCLWKHMCARTKCFHDVFWWLALGRVYYRAIRQLWYHTVIMYNKSLLALSLCRWLWSTVDEYCSDVYMVQHGYWTRSSVLVAFLKIRSSWSVIITLLIYKSTVL